MGTMNAYGPFFRSRASRAFRASRASRLVAFAAMAALSVLSPRVAPAQERDYDSLEEADRRDSMRGTMRVETEQAPDGSTKARLRISVDVPKTDVYLNGAYEGVAPVDIDGIQPGTWRVALKKRGYYTESFLVRVRPGETRDIRVELLEVTGYISIYGAPRGAVFEIDGSTYDAPLIRVGEGTHTLTVKAFGYEERTHTVAVYRERETKVDAALERAGFSVSSFTPSKRAFNPANPGRLSFTFRVTAPGSGTLRVRNGAGTVVRTIPTGEFATWNQSIPWDGTDDSGASLPDGAYRVTLEARPSVDRSDDTYVPDSTNAANSTNDTNGRMTEVETSVEIDGTILYPWASAFRGSGSIGPIPLASLTPARDGLAHGTVEYDDGSTSAGFAALYGITARLEAGGRVAVVLDRGEDDGADGRIAGALALKYGRGSQDLRWAVEFGYDSREGLSLAPTVEFRLSRLSVGASAALTLGDGTEFLTDPGLTAGAGAFARVAYGSVSAGIWAFAGSNVLAGKGSAGSPSPTERLSFGSSLQAIIPSTNLSLSLEVGWEKAGDRDGLAARAGFGVLF